MKASTQSTSLRSMTGLIALGIFATMLADPSRLGTLPLQELIKDKMSLETPAMSFFFLLVGLPAYLRPVAAVLSDYFPFLGTRRRHYLLASMFSAAAIWAVVAVLPPTYGVLLLAMTALTAATTIGHTTICGLMVDGGHTHGAPGRLNVSRTIASSSTTLIAGPLSGWLAGRAFGWTCAAGAALSLSLGLCLLLFLRETPAPPAPATARKLGRELLRSLLSRDYRVAASICVLFYAAPSFTDPFYYYQTDTLGLSSQTIGWFKFINCLGGIVGAIAYAAFCRRFGLRVLLPAGILAYAACMLLYLGYHSMRAGIVIEGLAGFLIALSALPFYQLSTRVSPARSGAFAFAVLVGISKAVGGLSRLLGAQLQVWFDLDLRALIWISALSAAAVVLLIPLLPAALLDEHEGEGPRADREAGAG